MGRSARRLRIGGTLVASAALCALVLQIMLASALAAASPPGRAISGALHLCMGEAASEGAGDDASPPQAHCPLCFCRVDATTPPPSATPVIERFAIERRFNAPLGAAALAQAPASAFQPRGPPPGA